MNQAALSRARVSSQQSEAHGLLGMPEAWAFLLYTGLTFATSLRHERWADEAQAWLIARDCSLWQLWTHVLRLEGTPGLWHSLLHGLAMLGLPYEGLNLVSATFGSLAAALMLRFAPFPRSIRLLLPFTYFLYYQYAVVARSYSLAPALLFTVAIFYRPVRRQWIGLGVALSLLAMVSTQGFLLAVAIALVVFVRCFGAWQIMAMEERRFAFASGIGFGIVAALVIVAVWPDHDSAFVGAPNSSLRNAILVTRYGFQQAFGPDYWPLAVLLLSLPLLWRGKGLAVFCLSGLLLCGFGSVVYSNVWHHGFLLLAWIFALWVSAQTVKPDWFAFAALILVIVMQCSWSWSALQYDWRSAYSGSQAMAAYMAHNKIGSKRLVAIGFPSVAVQGYFPKALFGNFHGSSFWNWSKASDANAAIEQLASLHPDSVLLGYSSDADRQLWERLAVASGYRKQAQFEGHLFWRTDVFQPEGFELYAPGERLRNTLAASVIRMAVDPATADQLLWGASEAAPNGDRWTESIVGAVLQRPGLDRQTNATLQVDVDVPETTLRANGPLTMTAYAGGHRLSPLTIEKPGRYLYLRDVRAEDQFWSMVPVALVFETVRFHIDRIPGHVALLSSIGLVTP